MDDVLSPNDDSLVRRRVVVMQLILACILVGLGLFLVVALIVQHTGGIDPIDPVGMTTLGIVGSIIITVSLIAAAVVRMLAIPLNRVSDSGYRGTSPEGTRATGVCAGIAVYNTSTPGGMPGRRPDGLLPRHPMVETLSSGMHRTVMRRRLRAG